jgi:hypothetical protein
VQDAAILTHLLATMALYYQFMKVMRPPFLGAVIYAVAFLMWWAGLFVMAISVGLDMAGMHR